MDERYKIGVNGERQKAQVEGLNRWLGVPKPSVLGEDLMI
jgi:hypothetical protein